MAKRYVIARLELVGDGDDGMVSVYTGCVSGMPPALSIAVIAEDRIVDVEQSEQIPATRVAGPGKGKMR